MLLHSRRPGAYSDSYTQFEKIRKLRSEFSNHCQASAKANQISLALGDQKGRYQRFATDPCSSFWFYRFIEGARNRMGQDWRPNKAISIELLLLLLESADGKVLGAVSTREKNRWTVFHTYVTVCYTVSLRGCEGFLLDLAGLNRKFNAGSDKYIVIALLGKIKGKSGDRAHLLQCVPLTSSGIDVRKSVSRLMALKQTQGYEDGPAISDERERVLSHRALNDSLLEVLEDLFDSDREVFSTWIPDKETLRKRIQVYRTLRRTSDTRALEQKVAQSDIDVVNLEGSRASRWQQAAPSHETTLCRVGAAYRTIPPLHMGHVNGDQSFSDPSDYLVRSCVCLKLRFALVICFAWLPIVFVVLFILFYCAMFALDYDESLWGSL
jgi:hypothetical protein